MQTPAPDLIRKTEFANLMHAYQDMVFSTAVRLLGNQAQAEDTAQEVFLKAFENFDQLRVSTTVGGWLKTVTTNLSLNHLSRYRKRWHFFSEFRRNDAEDDEPDIEFAVPDTLFEDIAADERQMILDKALNRLPDHQRVPLVLYHFEELSYDEIARRLNISLAKLKTDILRARVALAKLLMRADLIDRQAKQ